MAEAELEPGSLTFRTLPSLGCFARPQEFCSLGILGMLMKQAGLGVSVRYPDHLILRDFQWLPRSTGVAGEIA